MPANSALGRIGDMLHNEPMYIRPLTSNDESFLRDVLYHAIYVPPGEDAPPYEMVREPELARYVTDWMKRPEDLGFAAEENGELIGAAWLRRWPSSSERGFGFVDETLCVNLDVDSSCPR